MRARLALLGATGSVGEEIRRLVGERGLAFGELRLFGSPESEGAEVELRDTSLRLERVEPGRLADCDLVWSAAPGALEPLLPALRASEARVVDVTGALELDPNVPLWMPGGDPLPRGTRWVAIPRGIVAGLAMVLAALAREVEIERVTALTLESASGAGRRGLDELSSQTVQLLNAMDGEAGESAVFPRALAFDCLPAVGERVDCEDTTEERRLRQVLRRLLGERLAVECTRVRVPIFMGGLACVHVQLTKQLPAARACELWRAAPGLQVLGSELPTPRQASRGDDVVVGRIRPGEGEPRSLGFVVALDTLRRGAALSAVEVAELLLES